MLTTKIKILYYNMYQSILSSRMNGLGGINRISKHCKGSNNLLLCVFNREVKVELLKIIGKCYIGDVKLTNYNVILQIIDNDLKYEYRTKTDLDGNFIINTQLTNQSISKNALFYFIAEYNNIKLSNIVLKHNLNDIIPINSLTTISLIYSFNKYITINGLLKGNIDELLYCREMMNHICKASGLYGNTILTSPNKNETHVLKMLGNFENILYGCVRDENILNYYLSYTSTLLLKPKNTFEGIYSMCNNPGNNVLDIFSLSYSYINNTRYLTDDVLPNSFVICIKFNNSGNTNVNYTFGGPGNLVFDKDNKIWITNNVVQGQTGSSNIVIVLNRDGTPCDFSPIIMDYPMGSGYGIAVNSKGTVVTVSNFGWGGIEATYPIANFTYKGEPYSNNNYSNILSSVQGIIYDRYDNLWVCSYGNNRIAVFFQNNPSNFTYYDLPETNKPFHLKQDTLDENVVISCSTNIIKFQLINGELNIIFNTFITSTSDLLGLDLDRYDNIYVSDSTNNCIVKLNNQGTILQTIRNNSIYVPWGCTILNDKLITANFGSTNVTNKFNNNGYYSIGFSDLNGNQISPDNGYLLQSGGEEVLLSNREPLFQNLEIKSFNPLMRQTSCHFNKFGYLWITNNWKPPFLQDIIINPGGDGVIVYYGLEIK